MADTTVEAEAKAMPAEPEKKKEQSLPFYQLFSFADKYDYLLMISGSFGAIIHGSSMPFFFLLFGQMVNGFGKNQSDLHKLTAEVSKVLLLFHGANLVPVLVPFLNFYMETFSFINLDFQCEFTVLRFQEWIKPVI